MKIHLVGGFLGSGKTTAISNASKVLLENGVVPGVVTNDQGKYLVDSKFISLDEVANLEVTGGCFCCNFDQLQSKIDELINDANCEVVFAESVGSCTDLLATVVKPLNRFRQDDFNTITFSGFVDSQILLWHLDGKRLPFNEETNYIWLKQIEEAEILIVNKFDVLNNDEQTHLLGLANNAFSDKTLLFQNSLDVDSISQWLSILHDYSPRDKRKVIDVDYDQYGIGEANLAWLDEEITIETSDNSAIEKTRVLIQSVLDSISSKQLVVGHLKFLVVTPNQSEKLSFTTVYDKNGAENVRLLETNSVNIMVNARVQTSPDELRSILSEGVEKVATLPSVSIEENNVSFFSPGYPNPTHRMVD